MARSCECCGSATVWEDIGDGRQRVCTNSTCIGFHVALEREDADPADLAETLHAMTADNREPDDG